MGAGAMAAMKAGSSILGGSSILFGASKDKKTAKKRAKLRRQEGEYARFKSAIDEGRYRKDLNRLLGTAQMVAGASGFGQEGTNAAILDEITREGEIDAVLIRLSGELTAYRAEMEADIEEDLADDIMVGGALSAGSTFLGGMGSTYQSYSRSKNPWGS